MHFWFFKKNSEALTVPHIILLLQFSANQNPNLPPKYYFLIFVIFRVLALKIFKKFTLVTS